MQLKSLFLDDNKLDKLPENFEKLINLKLLNLRNNNFKEEEKSLIVATKHINNLFKSGEIFEKSNVQKMHIAKSDKPVTLYS